MTKILLPVVLLAMACGTAPAFEQIADSSGSAIVYGDPDTSHQAVVAYLKGSKCSATIVYRSGNTGYALTAAHCVGGALGELRQGNNHANGQFDVSYTVQEAEAHPRYAEFPLFNLAMLRFSGADASTPVIPVLAPTDDALASGSPVELVGYGNTEIGGTTLRHHVDTAIDTIESPRLFVIQQDGGICSGDSGGAMLADVASTEHVAGVISYVEELTCTTGRGVAVRVSPFLDTFIMPFINNTPYEDESCDVCIQGAQSGPCMAELIACLNDTPCADLKACVDGCDDDGCREQCFTDHGDGSTLYQAIGACTCVPECPASCTVDGDTDGTPDPCDFCPADPGKTVPGVCGCGISDVGDEDSDGVPDGCDLCSGGDDAIDTDGDDVADHCDLCPGGDDAADADGDGVPDLCDACAQANDSLDADGDGIPDACDEETCDDQVDNDGDGETDCDDAACVCPGGPDNGNGDPDGGCSCGPSQGQGSLLIFAGLLCGLRRRRR